MKHKITIVFIKGLLCPVISGLFFVGSAIAQSNWIEIGRNNNGDIVKINSEVQVSGAVRSVVMYELWILLDKPIGDLHSLKTQILARCESRSQALSSSEGLNQQGRVIKSSTVEDSELNWATPENDVYGKAFQMACNSR